MPANPAAALCSLFASLLNHPLPFELASNCLRIEARTVGEAEHFETAGIKALILSFDTLDSKVRRIRLIVERFECGRRRHALADPAELSEGLAALCLKRIEARSSRGNSCSAGG